MIVQVADISQVAAARRAAQSAAEQAGFDETRAGKVALIATELATNLIKHAGGGRMVIGTYADASGRGLELMSLDTGGGIADLARAMQDGTSTAGSKGNGLGSIRRQADVFDIFSEPGRGTALVARIAASARSNPGDAEGVVGSVVVPTPGEAVAGDDWAFAITPAGPTIMLVDGSGHGPFAEKAAAAAVEAFKANIDKPCVALLESIHRAMAPTRGGAVGVARASKADRTVRYVGVGNIAGVLVVNGEMKHMVSNNGIAGHIASRIREFSYPSGDHATVILHSDGLSNRWDVAAYPGLAFRHPSAIAGVLFRDHYRGRDDGAVVAMRI